MNLEIDISEITRFGKRLQNYDQLETALMTATQEIAKVLHKELLKRSPVDTGNLRKMWSAGDNLLFYVDRVPDGFEVTLVNEARNEDGYKYPWVVNYGYRAVNGRWVMGQFFVENSVAAVEQVAKKYIRKELAKWFMACVNGK
jgi:hypothetical protein